MSEKTAATWHPYPTALEAAQAERAAREQAEHERQVRGLTALIAKRAGLA